jgi:hypothetical protein
MPGKRRVSWRSTALGVITVAVTAATVLWFMARLPPAWYSPPQADDEDVQALADRVEYRLVEEAHKARAADEPWRLGINQDQVNAWLAARLREWIDHQRDVSWPEGLGAPQARLEAGGVTLGAALGADGRASYLAARIVPAMTPEGLTLRVVRLWHGRLPVPGDPVAIIRDKLAEHAPAGFLEDAEVRRWLGILEGREAIDPVVTLADGRRVRLGSIECSSGWVILEGRTLPP